MELTELQLDKKKVSGAWVEYGDEASFFIASTESKKYQIEVTKQTRRHPPHKVKNDSETQAKIAIESMAKEILLDFKGIENDGKPLKNTLENRRKILATPVLRDWISNQATDLSNFYAEGETADAEAVKPG